jgi:hypothetical protein
VDVSETFSASFAYAAAKLTRGQLLDLLLEIEDRLRILVRAVFSAHDDDWQRLIPEAVRSKLEAESTGKDDQPEDLLRYATLKQLIDTVLARWQLFQPIIDDKTWLKANLDELRRARNDLAHGRQPDTDERVRIALLASEVGKRLPLPAETARNAPRAAGSSLLLEKRILWADDYPEGNAWVRRLLTGFGAEVVPVLSNEEAVLEASTTSFDVAVSDIDRGAGEPGSLLGVRLKAAGLEIPIIFFIARVERSLPPPVGGVLVTNDTVSLLTRLLAVLRPDAVT